MKYKSKVTVTWWNTDVIEMAQRKGHVIDKRQAGEILENIERHHDADLGITWTTLDVEIDNYVLDGEEICIECGESVAFGSGNHVNRVPVLDDYDELVERNCKYPEGRFVCAVCDEKFNNEAGE